MSRPEDMSQEPGELDLTSSSLTKEARQERFADCFTAQRDRLRKMVDLRLDPRLKARVDTSDVLQDVYLEASKRLEEYVRKPPMSLFLWLRFLTGQKLHDLHRFHLRAQARDVRREVQLPILKPPDASTINMSAQLVAKVDTPSQAAIQEETRRRVQEGLERMDPDEREVLALRHFEGLSNVEAARVLEIEESAASKRYIRALERLKGILGRAGEAR